MSTFDVEFPDLVPLDFEEPATLPQSSDPAAEDPALGEISPELVIQCDDRVGARTHTLLVPLKVNGKWLRKITLRLPSQGDIDDWFTAEHAETGARLSRRELLARLADVHPLVIKALRWPDSEAVHQIFYDIIPNFVSED